MIILSIRSQFLHKHTNTVFKASVLPPEETEVKTRGGLETRSRSSVMYGDCKSALSSILSGGPLAR